MQIPVDHLITLRDTKVTSVDEMYKPNLRGGAVEFNVNLSSVSCGCVAGVYAVAQNATYNTDVDITREPPIASIDIMQASIGGFGVSANPCEDGSCSETQACSYKIAAEGKEKYGAGAYGSSGSLIDTDNEFTVRTEFVTKNDFADLWKIRTRLT